MSLSLHLKIVGASLLFLSLAHAFFPRRFHWREEMSSLSLLNRQMFQVHCFFIALVLFMFGLLALVFTGTLLEPTPLARDVLAAGGWPVLLTHGQSLFSNGLETGLAILDALGRRISETLADEVEWLPCLELAKRKVEAGQTVSYAAHAR